MVCPKAGCHGRGVCVKLANLPSKNTHHKQTDRPDQWCAIDDIIAGHGYHVILDSNGSARPLLRGGLTLRRVNRNIHANAAGQLEY